MARHTARIVMAVVIVGVGSLHAKSAWACSCLGDPLSPCAEATHSSDTIVFVGTALTEETIMLPTHIPQFPEERGRRTGFSVQETLVGPVRQFVHIRTSGSSCGYVFRLGEQYLVYAAGSEQ